MPLLSWLLASGTPLWLRPWLAIGFSFWSVRTIARPFPARTPLRKPWKRRGARIARAEWDGHWTAEQFRFAFDALDAQGARINYVTFAKGSVFNDGESTEGASGHRNTWRVAYSIEPDPSVVFPRCHLRQAAFQTDLNNHNESSVMIRRLFSFPLPFALAFGCDTSAAYASGGFDHGRSQSRNRCKGSGKGGRAI